MFQDPVRTVRLLERVLVERPQLSANWDLEVVLLAKALEVCIPLLNDAYQCCGSVMFIPDPGSEFLPSRIRIKEF
jgi:hypothetical protein